MRALRLFVCLFFVLPVAAVSADLAVRSPEVDNATLRTEATLSPAPSESVEFYLRDATAVETGKGNRGDAKVLPTDLWVLVDSSALCQSQKVDGYVNKLVGALRKRASPQTLVTLVSYTGESTDVLLKRKAAPEIEDVQVACEKRPFSASYDRPLAALLAEPPAPGLSTTVWVFTSGNIELSRPTAVQLAARDAHLELVLYNAFVEKDVRPVFQNTVSLLGAGRAHFSILGKADGAPSFPSMRYAVQFPLSASWAGHTVTLRASATTANAKPGEVLAKQEFTASVPLGGWFRFWRLYGRWIALALVLGGLAYGAVRIVRYYRVRHCAQCQQPVSFLLGECTFCQAAETPYLVGPFRRAVDGFGRALPADSVLFLRNATTELGAHLASPIRFHRRGGKRRLARIVRDGDLQHGVYRIERFEGAEVRVNGRPLVAPRCLGNGDTVEIDSVTMTFFSGGRSHGA